MVLEDRVGPPPTRAQRADARRNRALLIESGRRVYETFGVDAPFDDVAKAAGVSRATLYRHFDTREHLFAVLIANELDNLEQNARALRDAPDPTAAVERWLVSYDRVARAFTGMSRHVGAGMSAPGSPLDEACTPMKLAFAELLSHAQKHGETREDVSATEVLRLVAALPAADPGKTAAPASMRIVLSGLRR